VGRLHCRECDEDWDGSQTPRCPRCQATRWRAAPGLVSEKHDPAHLGEPQPGYRSVLTPHFIEHIDRFLDHAARHGRWFFDRHYELWIHYTPTPLGRAPGVGVRRGRPSPDHALDSLLIADAETAPHVFAVDRARTEEQIRQGEFIPLALCATPGCDNLRDPAASVCAAHRSG
jgi:hypothetical protein